MVTWLHATCYMLHVHSTERDAVQHVRAQVLSMRMRTKTRTKIRSGIALMSNKVRESSKQIKVRCALQTTNNRPSVELPMARRLPITGPSRSSYHPIVKGGWLDSVAGVSNLFSLVPSLVAGAYWLTRLAQAR